MKISPTTSFVSILGVILALFQQVASDGCETEQWCRIRGQGFKTLNVTMCGGPTTADGTADEPTRGRRSLLRGPARKLGDDDDGDNGDDDDDNGKVKFHKKPCSKVESCESKCPVISNKMVVNCTEGADEGNCWYEKVEKDKPKKEPCMEGCMLKEEDSKKLVTVCITEEDNEGDEDDMNTKRRLDGHIDSSGPCTPDNCEMCPSKKCAPHPSNNKTFQCFESDKNSTSLISDDEGDSNDSDNNETSLVSEDEGDSADGTNATAQSESDDQDDSCPAEYIKCMRHGNGKKLKTICMMPDDRRLKVEEYRMTNGTCTNESCLELCGDACDNAALECTGGKK